MTEFLQKFLLLVSALRLFYMAKVDQTVKRASILMGVFFLVCLIRENDYLFDKIVHGFWVYQALVATAIGIWISCKESVKVLAQQLAHLLSTHAGKQLIMSMAILLVFSRIWGMGEFWKDVMDEDYMGVVKTTSEEGLELVSYFLIAFSVYKLPFNKAKQ